MVSAFSLPRWKRMFDIVTASVALVVLSPLLIAVSIAIRIESKGPIVYKSKRVGTNYYVFDFLKFRSMYSGADKKLKRLSSKNQYNSSDIDVATLPLESIALPEELDTNKVILVSDEYSVEEDSYLTKKGVKQDNAFVKIENDPRVTKVGRFMRKYSIDELPQLINIIKGDMSIVGNRPLPLYEAEMLTGDDDIDRFLGPAGLTGLWQVEKRGEAGKLSAEERKQLDIYYAQNFSFTMDMKIILKTFTAFIQKENV